MIRFLKLNDPFRLVVIFFLLLIIRLPFWLGDFPLLSPELTWMLIGEKMNEGLLLYRDFDAIIAPLSAFTYQVIDLFFGRSPIVYQVIAFLLLFIQGVIFNLQINKMMVLSEKTYLPAFIYSICGSFFFDMYTLSPVLLSLTFLLLALGELFYVIKEGNSDENSFYIGFYLGISILFFTPMIAFILVFLIGSLLYTNIYFKGYFILAFGVLFPFFLLFTFYYWRDGLPELLTNVFYYSLTQSTNFLLFHDIIMIVTIPILFVSIAILKVLNATGFINYQVRIQSVMLFLLMMGVLILFFIPQLTMYHFLIFLPPIALFLSAFFLILTKIVLRGILFYSFLICMVFLGYSHNNYLTSYLTLENILIENSSIDSFGKILVLGENKANYQNNKVATIYIDWNLSKRYFLDLDNYENLSEIYTNIKNDIPDVIVDDQEIIPKLFQRIPEFEKLYQQEGNLYKLKK